VKTGASAPIRQPVEIASVLSREAQSVAAGALARTGEFAVGLDMFCAGKLAEAAVAAVCRGEARAGLKLGRLLAAARVGNGHAREAHFTSELTELADLAVRSTAVEAVRAVRYEHMYVKWARVGRDRNSLGTDRVKNVTAGLRFAGIAASCDDRHLPTVEIPFTTGTRHDHSSPRADLGEIERLTAQLGRRPAGTVAEHFKELLDVQRAARARVHAALERGGWASMLARFGFSDLAVLTLMPCGPAEARQQEGGEIRPPGIDRSLVRVLEMAGRRGVAQMGSRRPPTDGLSPAHLLAEGFEPRYFERSPTDDTLANDIEWGVTWYWKAPARCLLRVQVGEGTVRVDEWHVFGLDDDLETAVALVRRHEQKWTMGCIERYMRDTAPGLIEVSSYRSDVAVRDFLRIGNAATVHADRLARARHAAG
jgi:hypothetical protein